MAAAALTATAITRAGVELSLAAANGDGNFFTNTGAEFVVIKNTNVATRTITFVTQATVDSLAVADKTVTVAQNVTKIVGPFPRYAYSDASGYVQITYNDAADVTVAVFTLTAAGA